MRRTTSPAAQPPAVPESEPRVPRRNEKARNRTRSKLLAAARVVLGRDGIAAAKINDITDEAGLAFGSFYNYFSSKEELARAVFVEETLALTEMLDKATPPDADIAQVLAINLSKTLRHGLSDPIWGWFMVQSAHTLDDLVDEVLGGKLARDLRAGAAAGRFLLGDIDTTVDSIIGGCIYHLRQILAGRRQADTVNDLVEFVLCGLGLERSEAANLARLTS